MCRPLFRPPFFTSGTPSGWVFKCKKYSCWISFFHFEPLSSGNIYEISYLATLLGSFLWKFYTLVGVKIHPPDTPVGVKIHPADPSPLLVSGDFAICSTSHSHAHDSLLFCTHDVLWFLAWYLTTTISRRSPWMQRSGLPCKPQYSSWTNSVLTVLSIFVTCYPGWDAAGCPSVAHKEASGWWSLQPQAGNWVIYGKRTIL